MHLTTSGSASGSDFSLSSSTLTIEAGSLVGSVTVTSVDDSSHEPDETVIVGIDSIDLGTESGGAGAQQVSTLIRDDDNAPSISLELDDSSISENAGSTTLTARLSAAQGMDTTLEIATGGSATAGSDYTLSSSVITIPAGSLTGTITISR